MKKARSEQRPRNCGDCARMQSFIVTVDGIRYDGGCQEFGVLVRNTDVCRPNVGVKRAVPRNCDRFTDELDAQLAFLNEVWLISVDRETMTEQDAYENWTDEMRARYGRWLFAPATEQKGETDEQK